MSHDDEAPALGADALLHHQPPARLAAGAGRARRPNRGAGRKVVAASDQGPDDPAVGQDHRAHVLRRAQRERPDRRARAQDPERDHDESPPVPLRPQVHAFPRRRARRGLVRHAACRRLSPSRRARFGPRRLRHAHRRSRHGQEHRAAPARRAARRFVRRGGRHHRASPESRRRLLPRARRSLRRRAPHEQPLGGLQGAARTLGRALRHNAAATRAHPR